MEGRIRIFLLSSIAIVSAAGCASKPPPMAEAEPVVVEPQLDRRDVKPPRIDAENFEIGLHGGVMSVEDFGSNTSTGLRAAYHIAGGFFVEGSYGMTDTEKTSFEVLSGAAELLTDAERELSYYNLSVGYNLLPGEVFVGGKRAFNSALYVLAGAGATQFAGDDRFTLNFGMGARVLVTDWLALRLEFRDHLFDSDLLGETKTTHNLEALLGLTFFF